MKLALKLVSVLMMIAFLGNLTYSQTVYSSLNEARSGMTQLEKTFQTNPSERVIDSTSSLDDYIKLAALNNPAIKSAFYNWKADLEKTGYVGALADPVLVYGYFIENVETRVGPQNQRFSLRQSFPWFGSLGDKKAIAFEMSNVSFKQFQAEMLKIFYQVKAAYYDYYYLGRELEITRENIELLKFWESVVRTKYKVALSKHPDVIKAQVELGKLEDRLLSLENQLKPMKTRLAAVLNISVSTDFPIPESILIDESNIEETAYFNFIIENNPNIHAIKHLIEKENHTVSLADKSSLPNFTLGVDYIETGDALNPAMSESGKDPVIASVGISIPLWFGKNNAQRKEARAKKRSAEYLLLDKENQLKEMTENIIFQHNDALRKIQLYRDGLIPKAEQSLHAAYTSYQAGNADFLDVLDAQRQLLEFQQMLDMSITRLAKRKAELEMLAGFDIKRFNN